MSSLAPPAGIPRLVADAVASRIGEGEAGLWPTSARPGWAGAVRAARPLVGEIEALRERLRVSGQVRVVLVTTGGVGVAAEVLAGAATGAAEPRLIVLDGTDPVQVADALAGDLDATVLVVSTPPGEDDGTVELLRDTVHAAFRAEGLDPAAHTVVVTADARADPGDGATVVRGPVDVDGPWAAFTAFALVPAGLAGADVGAVLADAAQARPGLVADDPDNPALVLGALLADAEVVAVAQSAGDGYPPGTAEWVSQLLAAGLGKDGRGPLPVLVEGPDAPGWHAPGTLPAGIGELAGAAVAGTGPVAAQLLLWQHATAVAAYLLGVDPTDRPDALPGAPAAGHPQASFSEGGVDVHAGAWLPAGTGTVADALRALRATAGGDGDAYLSVHAYLDRLDDASAAVLRAELARRTGLPTTFGWAPRCLAGTGQHDKGGPGGALVCQLTGDPDEPGRVPDALAQRQLAQAGADAAALAGRGRPVLRLHLTDRVLGLVTLARAVQQL